MTASARPTAFPNEVIRASAGTGKTFQLSNRYLALVHRGEPPDRLLAATFARKAAGEILERVLLRLADAALDAGALGALGEHLPDPRPDRDHVLAMLGQLLGQLHRLRIGTLDSFFAQLASSHALELGLPLGWTIVDDVQDGRFRDRAVRQALAQEHTGDLTRLMHLLHQGATVSSVAEQMRRLIDDLYDVYLQTDRAAWHAIDRPARLAGAKVANLVEQLAGLPPWSDKRFAETHRKQVASAEADDWAAFMAGGLAKATLQAGTYYGKPIPPQAREVYEVLARHARAEIVHRLADQTEATWSLLDRFHGEYDRIKHEARALRFDDLPRALARGLDERRLARTGFRLDAHLAHLLLDEFQDTSRSQWEVIRPVGQAALADGGTLFCVGDGKQAIYGWRGGAAEIFEVVERHFPGIRPRPLNESRRSSPVIIDVVNRVFGSLTHNPALDGVPETRGPWAERFTPHTTHETHLSGYCRMVAAPLAPADQKQNIGTLEYAAAEVAELARRHPGRSIGVLARSNEAVRHLIYALRTHHQVLASEEGGNPLTDSLAVQTILSLLRLVDHPGDTASGFHLATSPLGAVIGYRDERDRAAASALSLEIRRRLEAEGYGPVIYRWVEGLAPACDARELGRLWQLVDLSHAYQPQATPRTDDFIRYVEHTKVQSALAADVRVMTIHQSKGLEFDIVVLPELQHALQGGAPKLAVERSSLAAPITRVCRHANKDVAALLPDDMQPMFDRWKTEQASEALCVLYVALTRARQALHIIVPPSRPNERTLPKTPAGVLRGALAADLVAEPGEELFSIGHRDWDSPPRPAMASAAQEPAEIVVRLRPAGRQRRGLERQSPSRLAGGGMVELRDLLSTGHGATLRGSLLHAWCEQIEWLDDGPPDAARLRAVAAAMPLGSLDVEAELNAWRRRLEHPHIRAALLRQSYRERFGEEVRLVALRERRFALREGDHLLQGSIDRLVLVYRGQRLEAAEVLDFKSDRLADDAAIDAAVRTYQPQIAAYRHAVATLHGLPPQRIAARIVFLDAHTVRELSCDEPHSPADLSPTT